MLLQHTSLEYTNVLAAWPAGSEVDSYVQLELRKALSTGRLPSPPASDGNAERIAI